MMQTITALVIIFFQGVCHKNEIVQELSLSVLC